MAQFVNVLDGLHFHDSPIDVVRWNLNAIGRFALRSYFLHLSLPVGNALSSYVCGFPWNIICKSYAPLKASCFEWEASHGKILTYDNLQKRGKLWSIAASSAKPTWKPQTIFSSAVALLETFGI